MNLKLLESEYDKLQLKYGDKDLDSIYNGGCDVNPDICFVFMNPTKKNIASSKDWHGLKVPWIGTKVIWGLFCSLGLIDNDIYLEIKNMKGSEWTPLFAKKVYDNIEKHKIFITNLGKCTQVDARVLPDSIYLEYLELLEKEVNIINPRIIILFGNQVSSIFLNEKISVSKCRRECYYKTIQDKEYKCYAVYYPVGNGRFNMDKAIQDIKWIMENELHIK